MDKGKSISEILSHKKKIKKILFFLMIFIPLCLLVPVISHFLNKTFYVFPSTITGNGRAIETLTDSIWGGTSSIEEFICDSDRLYFSYILRNSKHKYPNVFIIFWLDSKEPYTDLSGYDYVTVRLKESTYQEVTIYIKTCEEGFSNLDHQHADTLRHNAKVISFSPSLKKYKINISEFVTQPWWYQKFKTSEKEVGKETYKKVVSFDLHFINFHNIPCEEEMESLIIEEIALHKNHSACTFLPVGALFLYYTAIIVLAILKYRKKRKSLPHYRHLSFINYRDTDVNRIKDYIRHNFYDPEISTIKMQDQLGVPSFRIFTLIKEEYGQSFKQLINTIRVEEAKRLLKESDLRIIDISYKVGFNDSSYFNKVFKKISGISPTEHRFKN